MCSSLCLLQRTWTCCLLIIMLNYYPETRFLLDSAVHIENINNPSDTALKRFWQNCVVSPFIWTVFWKELSFGLRKTSCPKHLLYASRFLKTYGSEELSSFFGGCDERTLLENAWYFVQEISSLQLVQIKFSVWRWWKWQWSTTIVYFYINFKSRFQYGSFKLCYMLIDVTNIPIHVPRPFSKKLFSYKLNNAGLRYEIAFSIHGDCVLWANGLYKPLDKLIWWFSEIY